MLTNISIWSKWDGLNGIHSVAYTHSVAMNFFFDDSSQPHSFTVFYTFLFGCSDLDHISITLLFFRAAATATPLLTMLFAIVVCVLNCGCVWIKFFVLPIDLVSNWHQIDLPDVNDTLTLTRIHTHSIRWASCTLARPLARHLEKFSWKYCEKKKQKYYCNICWLLFWPIESPNQAAKECNFHLILTTLI